MRPFISTTLNTCNTTLLLKSATRPAFSQLKQIQRGYTAKMSTGVPTSGALNIENKNIQTAPSINLTEQQQTIIGSVLDLFAGRPSLPKLALWRDDATFSDNITIATGREKYSAQWYGLQSAFSEIERLHHEVKDAGNPILIDMKTRYVIKGINKEQTIESVVAITTDEQGKISKVEDRWNGKLPDGPISNAFRHLNAVTVPKVISVPKNAEEDAKRGN
ncbi:hypothetical protein T440DRAFT_497120 [Plenodomus tracheiphilus IPT5]|uniref:SnoaL-like domain-containing protein n=1 Tax=Plenodomus tracheiphilus IPT5 TaxID=1408161 RepID=A0A6A7BFG4_9PLEO|nr:hypothetical protein T440DRAFT_497120 [Plenodomus tracheiphilus IPT5]